MRAASKVQRAVVQGSMVLVVVVGRAVVEGDVAVVVVVVVGRTVVEGDVTVVVGVVVVDSTMLDSKAPMSQAKRSRSRSTSAGSMRRAPRWSVGGHSAIGTASIAGLPAWSAMVCVGPPLLASPAGSSSALVLQSEVPLVLEHPAPVKPYVVPSSML